MRKITEYHAEASMELIEEAPKKEPQQNSKQMILEMDGSMIPLVEYKRPRTDNKKKRLFGLNYEWASFKIKMMFPENMGFPSRP